MGKDLSQSSLKKTLLRLLGAGPVRFALILLLFASASGAAPDAEAGDGGSIRVLVLKDENVLTIKGAKGEGKRDGIVLKRSFPGTAALNGEVVELPIRFEPRSNFINVNGRPYRGALDVYDEGGGLMVVDELPLEEYLVGIINHEISSKWHIEAVKAQAVIARTYALHKKNGTGGAPYDLEGTVLGQVYKGVNAEDLPAARAVRATRGEVLTYGGEPALTVYHSNAAGRTDSSGDIWTGEYPYLKSVGSPHDSAAPNYSWELSVTASDLGRLLRSSGIDMDEPVSIRRAEVLRSGRVTLVEIRDSSGRKASLTGEEMRKMLGYGALKSAVFKVRSSGDSFVFSGRGSGHGVGLSQWGAKGMAEAGYSYKRILSHYYPGTRLKRVY